MSSFPETPDIKVLDPDWYELQTDYHYVWEKDDVYQKLIVRSGFKYNMASIPWYLRSLIGHQDLGLAPPLFHDMFYACSGYTFDYQWGDYYVEDLKWIQPDRRWKRKDVDRLFGRHMREVGIPSWKRKAGYLAVRSFGWISWDETRAGNKKY